MTRVRYNRIEVVSFSSYFPSCSWSSACLGFPCWEAFASGVSCVRSPFYGFQIWKSSLIYFRPWIVFPLDFPLPRPGAVRRTMICGSRPAHSWSQVPFPCDAVPLHAEILIVFEFIFFVFFSSIYREPCSRLSTQLVPSARNRRNGI